MPSEKSNKLETSMKKGTFVAYNDILKIYRIYIPRKPHIEVIRDFTFDEEFAFKRSIE